MQSCDTLYPLHPVAEWVSWAQYERQAPLTHQTLAPPIDILLTRPQEQSKEFAQALGVEPVLIAPLIHIVPVPAPDVIPKGAVAIFSSVHGVYHAPELPRATPAYCIGERTAAAAKMAGYEVRAVALTAAQAVVAWGDTLTVGPYIHFSGAHHRGDVAETLCAKGHHVTRRIVYDQVAQPLSDEAYQRLNASYAVVVALFSPRSAELFVKQGPYRAPIYVAALSDAVAQRLTAIPHRGCYVAKHPRRADMIEAVLCARDAAKTERER